MKCVVCKSSDINKKLIEEEVKAKNDIVLIPMEVLVCRNCGERYYDRNNMKKLEEIKTRLRHNDLKVEEVGKVLRAHAA